MAKRRTPNRLESSRTGPSAPRVRPPGRPRRSRRKGRGDGAVVSMVEVGARGRSVAEAPAARDLAAAMLDQVRVPVLVLDDRLHVRSANRAFFAAFGGRTNILGASWFDIDDGAWDVPALRAALGDLLAGRGEPSLDVAVEFPAGQPRTVAVSGGAMLEEGAPPLLFLTLVDVTERADLVRAAEEAN